MSTFWNNKRVLLTGGLGFIGSHLTAKLLESGARVAILDNASNPSPLNKKNTPKDVEMISGECKDPQKAQLACKGIEVVMHLAAKVAGVAYNQAHKGSMLSENLLIQTTMMDAAQKAGVERFLAVSSAVVYPSDAIIPTPESEGLRGEPEEVNGGYGWAKRVNELLARYYHEEFGFEVAVVRPYNCYGPGDHFFPTPTHVIPSLIRRVMDGEDPVVVWGSGRQTRAFLYVEDLVRGMMLATEKYAVADPVNLGSDEEVTMKQLIETIIRVSGKASRITFDTTKPDGSMRRNSDNRKAKDAIGFTAQIPLEEGLKKTIEWYNTIKL
ncbi:MAG: NAD-dependent epimerase/dehydratase family protein [Candidatus Gottesmanbacteria bacterium]|nr:NAD-dependent epimerase/dehydratase family protein [Candidatus Gottesmanbacteria bacterium]